MRKLTVLTDGIPLNAECRFHLRGRLRTGLFPSLFLLECWNLSDADNFRLRNTKELSVYSLTAIESVVGDVFLFN